MGAGNPVADRGHGPEQRKHALFRFHLEDMDLHEVTMTDITYGASAPDDDCFVSTFFDQALRQRETESATAIDRGAGNRRSLPHAELPPQEPDRE